MSNFVHWKANYNNSQIIPIPANDHFVPINIRVATNTFQTLGEFFSGIRSQTCLIITNKYKHLSTLRQDTEHMINRNVLFEYHQALISFS